MIFNFKEGYSTNRFLFAFKYWKESRIQEFNPLKITMENQLHWL